MQSASFTSHDRLDFASESLLEMGSAIDHLNDWETYRRFRDSDAVLQDTVSPGRYARRALFTNDFVRSAANPWLGTHHQSVLMDPSGYDGAYIPGNSSAGICIRDLWSSLLADYLKYSSFNRMRQAVRDGTPTDNNRYRAMERCWLGRLESPPSREAIFLVLEKLMRTTTQLCLVEACRQLKTGANHPTIHGWRVLTTTITKKKEIITHIIIL